MTTVDWILAADDDVAIPARIVKKAIRELGARTLRPMITVARASEIMEIDQRQLRRRCQRWERLEARGAKVDVHVTRVGADGSAFRLDEEDCWEYRRRNGGKPKDVSHVMMPAVVAEDDEMAAADRYADELIRQEYKIG